MKFIIVLLILTNFNVCLSEESEFKLGYLEGLKNCSKSDEVWACYVNREPKTFCNDQDSTTIGFGKSRAEAIMMIERKCRIMMLQKNIIPTCKKI